MNLPAALSYTYSTIERHVVCKPDAIVDLCGVLDRLRAASAMVICGPTILQHANVVQRVQSALGQRCVGLFAGVLPHAPVEMFEDAIRMVRDLQPDALVSVYPPVLRTISTACCTSKRRRAWRRLRMSAAWG